MKGNDTQTTARKKHLLESLAPAFGAKRVGIFHEESVSGGTGIDLTDLNMPSTYSAKGYSNPSDLNIQLLRLSYFKNNVRIISSDRGTLTLGEYDIPSNTQINFDGFTSNANEIFEIWFEPSVIGGATVVDARPLVKSYLLPEGQTDVVVEPFEINKNPLEQIGAVMVFRGPAMNLQFRNSGNATAAPSADGNYEEVKGTGGLTSLIRFNVAASVGGENVVVVSVGSLMERPTQSMISYLENMNGDVDKIRDTVAALSGQPKSNFNGQPQTVDLATFGERFNAILNTEISIPIFISEAASTAYIGASGGFTLGNGTANALEIRHCNRKQYILYMQIGSTTVFGGNLRGVLPSGDVIDTAKISDNYETLMSAVTFNDDSTNTSYQGNCLINNNATSYVECAVGDVGERLTNANPVLMAVNDQVWMNFIVPIVGQASHETKTLKELAGL